MSSSFLGPHALRAYSDAVGLAVGKVTPCFRVSASVEVLSEEGKGVDVNEVASLGESAQLRNGRR